jgi:hypothetical protein
MERVKQLEFLNYALAHTLVLLWEITLPAKPNSKQQERQLLSNVSTVEVALKMLTTKQNRKPWDTPWLKCGKLYLKVSFIPIGKTKKLAVLKI